MCLIHQLQCLRHGGCQVNVCRTSLRSMPCWTARSLVPVHCQALTSKMLLIDKLLAISPKVPIFTCNFISYHLTWTFLSNHTAMFTVYKAHLYLVLSLIVHLLNQCSLLWFLLLFFFSYNQIISILQTQTQTHLLPKVFLVTPIHQPLSFTFSTHGHLEHDASLSGTQFPNLWSKHWWSVLSIFKSTKFIQPTIKPTKK